MKREPTMVQAGVYGAIMHYLAAIKATGSDDGPTVVKQMKATPVNDFMTKNGKIREDGTLVRDMYLFEVKKPSESKGPWDYYKQIAVIPGEEAFKLPGPNQSKGPWDYYKQIAVIPGEEAFKLPAPTNARWSRADNDGSMERHDFSSKAVIVSGAREMQFADSNDLVPGLSTGDASSARCRHMGSRCPRTGCGGCSVRSPARRATARKSVSCNRRR